MYTVPVMAFIFWELIRIREIEMQKMRVECKVILVFWNYTYNFEKRNYGFGRLY
jgi:hypothetical protein